MKPLPVAALNSGVIHGETIVAHAVDAHPELGSVLVELGFDLINNPMLRRTVARGVTLRQACALKGKDLDTVLARLNAAGHDNVAHLKVMPTGLVTKDRRVLAAKAGFSVALQPEDAVSQATVSSHLRRAGSDSTHQTKR
jgi:hypothetical protein